MYRIWCLEGGYAHNHKLMYVPQTYLLYGKLYKNRYPKLGSLRSFTLRQQFYTVNFCNNKDGARKTTKKLENVSVNSTDKV